MDESKKRVVKKSDLKISEIPNKYTTFTIQGTFTDTEMENLSSQKVSEQNKSTLSVTLCDITTLNCECIVNAANNSLCGGGGVDGAIHRAAGSQLLEECRTLHGCQTGQAKITYGYNLPCKWVIHTVGPVYSDKINDISLLANCYYNSLNLAKQHYIKSIAFPSISTGAYRFPLQKAVPIAVNSVTSWICNNTDYLIDIIFCCFDQTTYQSYQKFLTKKKI